MKLYGKFKTSILKGDYVTFDTFNDILFKVLNVSGNKDFILLMKDNRATWFSINKVCSVYGVERV